ncbi:MAG: hypothetical protein JWM10_2673, partial [Myxococcaceae bacterium]|nr:hypothetical protein [Myxococcaceae bacterium]
PTTEAPVAPWCFEPMARVDLRAIDDEGRLWTLRGDALSREGDARPAVLPDELPCPARGGYALEFFEGGAAAALVDGRFYLRASRDAPFLVTPVCTDVGGAPWSVRAAGGWHVVANARRSVGPAVLVTREANAATGWYAVTALDRSITAGVFDASQSLLELVNEGHLILVDQRQTVAGEVLAAHGEGFTTLSRTAAGVLAAHDAPGARRVLVTARSLSEPFTRVESSRDRESPTRAAWVVDLARVFAVTDDAVEVSVDRGRSFRTVLRREPADGGAGAFERPQVGRLRDGRLAVATRDGLAVERCR